MNQIYNNDEFREVVLFSKVKLLRNIENLPFCNRMTKEQKDVVKNIITQICSCNEYLSKYLKRINLENDGTYNDTLVKQELSQNTCNDKLAFVTQNNEVTIFVNDIEHLTIQAKCRGLDLSYVYNICDNIDDIFDDSLRYSFDSKLGYLTSSPYDLGTALRASVVLHLPALEDSGMMQRLSSTIEKMGLRITSIFSNIENNGAIYKISNQLTLGINEKDSIQNLDSIVRQVIDSEILARNNLMQNSVPIEDNVFRSLGILKYARMISVDEFLNLYSKVRFGIAMNIIDNINLDEFDELLNMISDGSICNTVNQKLSLLEMDYIRAKVIRERLR